MSRLDDMPVTRESMHCLRTIPRSIWALGFVSMFMDISSEMIHSLLPVFIVSVLGASATALGLLEGIAERSCEHIQDFLWRAQRLVGQT